MRQAKREDKHMSGIYSRLCGYLEAVRAKTDFLPQAAVVLGSGLGGFADELEVECTVDYRDIEGFPVSTVAGHRGRFIFGRVGGSDSARIVCMQGRVHYYEGYSIQDVVMPIRLMRLMGAESILLTNAAGGINPSFRAGDLMVIKDHISLFAPNPLVGENDERLGERFPDMSEIYSRRLTDIIRKSASDCGIELREGVYVQLTGPSYESPAEISMLGKMGADAVGMSTACEAVAARHCGMEVCGISCISNMAAGISKQPLSHEEVRQTADRTAPLFRRLVSSSLAGICGQTLGEVR